MINILINDKYISAALRERLCDAQYQLKKLMLHDGRFQQLPVKLSDQSTAR